MREQQNWLRRLQPHPLVTVVLCDFVNHCDEWGGLQPPHSVVLTCAKCTQERHCIDLLLRRLPKRAISKMNGVSTAAIVAAVTVVLNRDALKHAMRGDALAERVHAQLATVGQTETAVQALYDALHSASHDRKLIDALETAGVESKPAGRMAVGGYFWGFFPRTSKDPAVGCKGLWELQQLINSTAVGGDFPEDMWRQICDPNQLLTTKRPGKALHLLALFGARDNAAFEELVEEDLGPFAGAPRRGKWVRETPCGKCEDCVTGHKNCCNEPILSCVSRGIKGELSARLQAMDHAITGLDPAAVCRVSFDDHDPAKSQLVRSICLHVQPPRERTHQQALGPDPRAGALDTVVTHAESLGVCVPCTGGST